MVSRDDVTRLNRAVQSATSLAQGDVAELLSMLAALPPERAAVELKALLPEITDRYGDIVAAAAAEWYEDVRAGELGTAGYARVGSLAPVEQVTSTAAYAAGGLFTESGGFRPMLLGAVQRYVAYAARSTVARNANLEKGEVRWARVPSGAKTCAWCSMLASRGWVYTSQERAGQNPSDFHDDCDCQIVPNFDRDAAHIDGYDPDRLHEMYQEARSISAPETQENIAASMRELYPDVFTDGHVH